MNRKIWIAISAPILILVLGGLIFWRSLSDNSSRVEIVDSSLSEPSESVVSEFEVYPDEFLYIRDRFADIPQNRRIVHIGRLARGAEPLPDSNSYKREVLDVLVDILVSEETDRFTKAYIPEALRRFGFLGVDISPEARSKLEELLSKRWQALSIDEIELLGAFEVEGHENLFNEILDRTIHVDEPYSYEGSISDIPAVAWAVLITQARAGTEEAVMQAITIVENSTATDKMFLLGRLGSVRSPAVLNYLAYMIFSDETVQVRFDIPNPYTSLAWIAVGAISSQFQDFPFSLEDSTSEEERAEIISQVREWLETHPDVDVN